MMICKEKGCGRKTEGPFTVCEKHLHDSLNQFWYRFYESAMVVGSEIGVERHEVYKLLRTNIVAHQYELDLDVIPAWERKTPTPGFAEYHRKLVKNEERQKRNQEARLG